MFYHLKHPYAKNHEEVENCIVYFDEKLPCQICKTETHFVDIIFEEHICSEECDRKISEGWRQAINFSYIKNFLRDLVDDEEM
jgi:hypothetical protein